MKLFKYGTNSVHEYSRPNRWRAVGILLVFLIGITLIVGLSRRRNIEGEYRTYWFGREI